MFNHGKLAMLGVLVVLVSLLGSNTSDANEDQNLYLPLVIKPPAINNGDFELGPSSWYQYSSNGWPLILDSSVLLVPPHTGSWAVWMGGDTNEDSVLWQMVSVPISNPVLRYWYWIASEDICGYDVAGVAINLEDVVDGFWLCSAYSTGQWVARNVDLSTYAGQIIELDFVAFTDDTLNSNLFLDDVSLGLGIASDNDAGILRIGPGDSSLDPKMARLVGLGAQGAARPFGQATIRQLRTELHVRAGEGQ
jgi:hypothetical protein